MLEQENVVNSYPSLLCVKSFKEYFLFFSLGPHDGIGSTVKQKFYQQVLSGKRVIEDAK